MNTQITTIPKLYIGIDIHKCSWKIRCSTDLFSGKLFSMVPKPEELKHYTIKHYSDYEVSVAYESGFCGSYYAHRCFVSYGWESLVVNPTDIHRKGKEIYIKTDKIDAQLIHYTFVFYFLFSQPIQCFLCYSIIPIFSVVRRIC